METANLSHSLSLIRVVLAPLHPHTYIFLYTSCRQWVDMRSWDVEEETRLKVRVVGIGPPTEVPLFLRLRPYHGARLRLTEDPPKLKQRPRSDIACLIKPMFIIKVMA